MDKLIEYRVEKQEEITENLVVQVAENKSVLGGLTKDVGIISRDSLKQREELETLEKKISSKSAGSKEKALNWWQRIAVGTILAALFSVFTSTDGDTKDAFFKLLEKLL